ncbi:bacteriophage protein [Thioalkalivibrio sulfidiphilus HL-EbGr7]|uniref:Bacteriophage protein n=1 Tax=Thioalkalivibrio sulfidiphilus (strain HL-EbGR7) TaxID=396588 RepID=B8GS32_THISH|nr:regulatory protein GemA [Thioalkalivibrio sulfidiphilus]ACL72736.1 bacteriophage protein [Thioalkalivibrio sulfidiphilus HL-EbGr7]
MISRGKLAQIHIAKQQLGLDDEAYRALLARAAGVSSSKQLDDRGVTLVLNEFKRLGFKPRVPKRAGRLPNTFNKHEQMAKIEAQLADMGLAWAYAEAIAKRQTGIERLDWLRTEKQFKGVIAALHIEQEKRGYLEYIDRCLVAMGETRENLPRRYRLPQRWERNLPVLKALAKALPEPPRNTDEPACKD